MWKRKKSRGGKNSETRDAVESIGNEPPEEGKSVEVADLDELPDPSLWLGKGGRHDMTDNDKPGKTEE